jgi:hypothetical protein
LFVEDNTSAGDAIQWMLSILCIYNDVAIDEEEKQVPRQISELSVSIRVMVSYYLTQCSKVVLHSTIFGSAETTRQA